MQYINLKIGLKGKMYTLCKSIIYLTGFAVFISGCASTARIKTSRTDIEKKEEIVHAEDIKILPPRKTLNTGEKLVYGITWLGVPVGTITSHIKGITQTAGRSTYHIELTAATNEFCSAIYKINDKFTTYLDTETLLPVRHELSRQEGRHKKNYIVKYDNAKHTATYHNLIENWTRTMNIPEGALDPLGVLYFARTLNVEVGTPIKMWVNMNEKNYEVNGKIEKKTIIEVPKLGTFDVFAINPIAKFEGKLEKKGRAWGYITCDEARMPVFGTVDVWVNLIGRVALTLQSIENTITEF